MADTSILILFFSIIVSFLSMVVLASAAKVLKGWKRGAAIVLSVLSGVSVAVQLMILLAVLALGSLS